MGIKHLRFAAILIACAGSLLVSYGVGMIYLPAGLVVLGAELLVLGLVPDWDDGE